MQRNGERFVLECLRQFHPKVVFDVGAHNGDWTQTALDALPFAVIHSFEIAPATAQQLKRRFDGQERVRVHDFGLDERSGRTEFAYLGGDHSGSSLLAPRRTRAAVEVTEGQPAYTQTGDEFCAKNAIESIDFLKVDVEGGDLRVLRGFARMFERGAIGLCQFEHNAKAIESHTLLVDFYELLERRGYTIGKLWARGVSFGRYNHWEDNFRGPNFLAVHESLPDLRAKLQYEPKGFR